MAPRVAVIGGLQILLGMAAPVHKDLPVAVHVALEQENDQLGGLDDLIWKGILAWHAIRQTIGFRIGALSFGRRTILGELDSPRLQRELLARLEVDRNVTHVESRPPDRGQVWLPIGGARRRSRRLRLKVF